MKRLVLLATCLAAVAGALMPTAIAAAAGRITYSRAPVVIAGPDLMMTSTAYCPAGTKVTGGDFQASHLVLPWSSLALADGSGWRVSVRADIQGAALSVRAVCVAGLTDYSVTTDFAWVDPGTTRAWFQFCGAGKAVGGSAMTDSSAMTLKRSTYFANGGGRDAWVAMYRNSDVVGHKEFAQVICANGINLSYAQSATYQVNEPKAIMADCPSGTSPLSGGGFAPRLYPTFPFYDDKQWAIDVAQDDDVPTERDAQATVICGV